MLFCGCAILPDFPFLVFRHSRNGLEQKTFKSLTSVGLTGPKSRCYRAGSFWRLQGRICSFLFQLLKATYIPWLVVSSSIFKVSSVAPSKLNLFLSLNLSFLSLTLSLPSLLLSFSGSTQFAILYQYECVSGPSPPTFWKLHFLIHSYIPGI